MTPSFMPDVTVDLALTSGYTTAAASRTWTDVTTYVENEGGQGLVKIQRGRGDEQSVPAPSRLDVPFSNNDGRFTPELVTGAYYPNIKRGRPIRVRAGIPNTVVAFDTFSDGDSTLSVWDGPSGPGRTTGGTLTYAGLTADWGILSQRCYQPTIGGKVWLDPGIADVELEVTYTIGATRNSSGVIVRWVDDNNHIKVTAEASGWILRKKVAGVTTTIATAGAAAVSTSYNVRVVCAGTSVEAFINGVSTVSGTISDGVLVAATKFGFISEGAADHFWDSFWLRATVYSYRFLGNVDEWPVSWPGGSEGMSVVEVSASSRRARLGRSAALRPIVEEENISDVPKQCWPLGEPAGATEAGNLAAGSTTRLVVTQIGAGGTLTFGAGTGPGTDSLTAPVFTPASSGNAKMLAATIDTLLPNVTDQAIELEVWFVTSVATQSLAALLISPASNALALSLVMSGGNVTAQMGLAVGFLSATSAATANDGLLHHAVLKCTHNGAGTFTIKMILDGVVATTGPSFIGGTTFPGDYRYVVVGGTPPTPTLAAEFTGTMAHVAVYSQQTAAAAISDARFLEHYNAGANGFAGEASGARIARYARLAGIPTAEVSVETGLSTSIAHRDTTGRGPVELMDDVARTEDGVVFDGKDGTLTFHARSHRYGASSAFTLDVSAGYIEAGLSPRLDDQGLLNDMSVSRPDGATARSINQTSIDDHGYYRDDIELMTTSDNEVQDRANWEVGRRGVPRVAIPNVRINLLSARAASEALFVNLLAADIGTRFTLSNLPANAPASTMDFFIEGITDEIGRESYFLDFNVSPAAYSTVWALDSATNSQLDSTTVLGF